MHRPDSSANNNEVRQLHEQIEDYQKKIAEANALVIRVRHGINNPLTAVLGQAQLLLREGLSDRIRTRAEAIETEPKRIQEIIGELRVLQLEQRQ